MRRLTPALSMKPSSKLFLALSHAPPPEVIEMATNRPLTMTPSKEAPRAAKAEAFNITQDRIIRPRLAGDPPDVLITARMSKIGLFEFHRADERIAPSKEAARKAIDEIREHIDLEPAAKALTVVDGASV